MSPWPLDYTRVGGTGRTPKNDLQVYRLAARGSNARVAPLAREPAMAVFTRVLEPVPFLHGCRYEGCTFRDRTNISVIGPDFCATGQTVLMDARFVVNVRGGDPGIGDYSGSNFQHQTGPTASED